jgi:predicted LPLAT superfamily acyltransferase
VLTVYAFSTENWRRPPEEVDAIMDLLRQYLRESLSDFQNENIRTRFIGDRAPLAEDIRQLMEEAEATTAHKTGMQLNIAVNYGGRHEIVEALDRGEILSAFADRFMNINKVVVSTIHGFQVNLAKGPFSLATTRGIDVIMASAMKEKDGSYTAYFTPLPYDRSLPKAQQRQQIADAYTAEIERLLDKYPYQWFNYSNLFI